MTTLVIIYLDISVERKYFTISLAANEAKANWMWHEEEEEEDGEIHVYLVIIFLA